MAEAEQRFAALRIRYQAGGLGNAAYEAKLQKLVVEDGAGGYWMLGADSREWHWYDGEQWVRQAFCSYRDRRVREDSPTG